MAKIKEGYKKLFEKYFPRVTWAGKNGNSPRLLHDDNPTTYLDSQFLWFCEGLKVRDKALAEAIKEMENECVFPNDSLDEMWNEGIGRVVYILKNKFGEPALVAKGLTMDETSGPLDGSTETHGIKKSNGQDQPEQEQKPVDSLGRNETHAKRKCQNNSGSEVTKPIKGKKKEESD